MTKKEYKEYEEAVASFFEKEGLNCLTIIDDEEEPYFIWVRCDVCDRNLGGDRVNCNGYNPTTKEIQGPYHVCMDCEYYIEYGQLDDMTMLDIEKE